MIVRVNGLVLLLIFAGTLAHAECPIDTVIVKGRIEAPPTDAQVRVRLMFPKNKSGESAQATLENDGIFNVPVEFETQSRGPIVNGLGRKCDRKPEFVIVSLMQAGTDQPLDELTLNFHRDFKMLDASAYGPRSEIIFNRPH